MGSSGRKLNTNEDDLVIQSVMGEVSNPVSGRNPYRISASGEAVVLPGVGGITYNVKVGDRAAGWAADHVEPGVSLKSKAKEMGSEEISNLGLNIVSCIGNEARIISGDAKGGVGRITGKHGGIEHVLVDFEDDILERLAIGDKIQVRGWGVGLRLVDHPDVKVTNLSPELLRRLPVGREREDLSVPVTHIVPASIMGSGLGSSHVHSGDYDIQMFDESMVHQYGLEDLRLGDLVAVENADHSYGRIYRKGGPFDRGNRPYELCHIRPRARRYDDLHLFRRTDPADGIGRGQYRILSRDREVP